MNYKKAKEEVLRILNSRNDQNIGITAYELNKELNISTGQYYLNKMWQDGVITRGRFGNVYGFISDRESLRFACRIDHSKYKQQIFSPYTVMQLAKERRSIYSRRHNSIKPASVIKNWSLDLVLTLIEEGHLFCK